MISGYHIFGNIHIFFRFKAFSQIQTFKVKKRRPSTGAEDSFRQCRNHHRYDCTMAYFGPIGWDKGKGTLSTLPRAGWKGWLWKRFFLTSSEAYFGHIDGIFVQKATAVFMFHCCWRKYHGVSYDCHQDVSKLNGSFTWVFKSVKYLIPPPHSRCFFATIFSKFQYLQLHLCKGLDGVWHKEWVF